MCTRISELVRRRCHRENYAAGLRSDESSCEASKSLASDAIRKGRYGCSPVRQHLPHYSKVAIQSSSFGR
jgi:hypothetical protein